MSMRFAVQISGADDLAAGLAELPVRIAKGAVRRSLVKAAAPMEAAAQANAPDARIHVRTVVATTLTRRQRSQAKGLKLPGVVMVYVGVRPLRTAHLFEFGTAERTTTGKGRTGKVPPGLSRGKMTAAPFMRPAFDSTVHNVLTAFGHLLGQEIEAAAVRIARKQAKLLAKGR